MKNEMSEDVLPDVSVQRYRGPHEPEMPADTATRTPLSLKGSGTTTNVCI